MKHLPSPVAYREDINGLRAWAVIAVLLFHFQLPGLGAGFFGVDIFFVISGFLMTAIIVKGLERDNFSIWKFYMARARRILPALMVVIAVLLALGWFFLPTPDYQALGSQSAYSLSFLSNIHFWRSTGYFDAAAHEKWLLHTWSLAVEAQFYLLFPIFLIILWKIKPQLKTLFWGLGLVFIASLALSIVASSWKPAAAFYLLPTRGWELAAGGLAFLIGREVLGLQRVAKPLFWSGFALWVLAFALLDSSYAWPSGWALLPVLGTVLIILANQSQAKLTVNPIAQWLGDRSYSLYLWHWPLVVALYFAGLQNDWLWVSGAIALSLILAHLSYHLVEVPTRSYLGASGLRKEVFAIALAGLVIGLAAVSVQLFTFENRLPANIQAVAAESQNTMSYEKLCKSDYSSNDKLPHFCSYGNNETLAVMIGDSHASATFTSLGAVAEELSGGVLLFGKGGCRTIIGFKLVNNDVCVERNNHIFNLVNELDSKIPVVLVNRYDGALIGDNLNPERDTKPNHFFDIKYDSRSHPVLRQQLLTGITETACMLQKDRQVFVVRPIPVMNQHVPNYMSREMIFKRNSQISDLKITREEYFERHGLVWEAQDQAAEQCGVKILDPLPYLCDDKYCYGSRNGRPLYYDDDHLSEYGNKYLVPMFEQVFRDQLAKD
ncbi:acyltransferase [Thiomicrospira aerophila AL3]|uniref:Acyltransferase n=1 Tax=Thiomicrospira aerophila AL3 TaxID=717772 RepID=W0DTT3_9GAMM|nr:acyltransferase family protein [Thiomicrospira aerophila]AHF01857.1 acyltransferase [Thiomicrospira aerophila AL3]